MERLSDDATRSFREPRGQRVVWLIEAAEQTESKRNGCVDVPILNLGVCSKVFI